MNRRALIWGGVGGGVLILFGVVSLCLPGKEDPPPPPREAGRTRVLRTHKIATGSELVNKISGVAPVIEGENMHNMVARLPRDLARDEVDILYDILRHGDGDIYSNPVKNDIMNKLRNQDDPPADLTDLLLELYRDKTHDRVVRLYALQHLRPWYRIQNHKDPRIREAFFEALCESDTEIVGVALLALRYLAKDQDGFEKDEIVKAALEIAQDPAENQLTRISAIQVAADLQEGGGDATVYREFAEEGNPLMMRMSAIAALGQSGDRTHAEFLANVAASEGPLQKPAQVALKKLLQ